MRQNIYISSFIQFIGLLLLQLIIISQEFVLFGGLGFCLVYVLFLLQLPLSLGRVPAMSIAFVVGLFIDIFYNTAGMNAAACVLIMFIRPIVVKALNPQSGLDNVQIISISSVGFSWFSVYSITLIFIHHITLFFIHTFNSSFFWRTLSKSIISALFTYTVIIIVEYLFFMDKKRR